LSQNRVQNVNANIEFIQPLLTAAPESSYLNGAIILVDGGWLAGYSRDFELNHEGRAVRLGIRLIIGQ